MFFNVKLKKNVCMENGVLGEEILTKNLLLLVNMTFLFTLCLISSTLEAQTTYMTKNTMNTKIWMGRFILNRQTYIFVIGNMDIPYACVIDPC